ncbi:MAG: ATP-binding protein [Saprospiraceae bacterium]|nr:ATP-binding protein [Saprospiraceae bacterium]
MSNKIKNPTPQSISIYASLVISMVILLLFGVFSVSKLVNFDFTEIIILFLSVFFTCYLVFSYFLKNYIYRKIKLIYKNIRSTKITGSENSKSIDLSNNVFQDVGEEVALWAENRNKEIETLKAMETYRRNFLGDISHELKTPIFNIQGYIHTLLEGGLYDEKINKKFLTRAANNVERLHFIVEDLEAISRLETGEMKLDVQTFGTRKLTEEVIEDLEMTAEEMNIELSFKEGADQNFEVRADREKIRRVLMNLVVNSIKYGKIDGHTKIGFYDMDSYILIEVADNGIGIEKEHLKRVFERFFRADKSRSRKQGGSGLGLSIVKHITEAHKQTINLRSTYGVGSTFGFTLEKE